MCKISVAGETRPWSSDWNTKTEWTTTSAHYIASGHVKRNPSFINHRTVPTSRIELHDKHDKLMSNHRQQLQSIWYTLIDSTYSSTIQYITGQVNENILQYEREFLQYLKIEFPQGVGILLFDSLDDHSHWCWSTVSGGSGSLESKTRVQSILFMLDSHRHAPQHKWKAGIHSA